MTADPLDIVGRTIAEKYRIEELAGEGGFALVYRAVHTIWNQPVAVKFFTALSNVKTEQRAKFMESFVQEGAVLTELSSHSSNIVQARDVGTYTSPDGRWAPYMVLEWLEGMPLSRMLARERAEGRAHWTIEEMMGMLAPVASALDVAHARGIAHRDIKPGNLFVLGDLTRGGPLMIKILDFGLAKLMADQTHLHAALAKTGTSIKAFTPAFAAPEQFSRSYGATGPWTDVFALALVAIRMLCGRRPLQGDDAVQLAYSACHHEHRPTPRALGATVSDDVERVFAKALAVQPADRYARAGEFWSALHIAVYGAHGPSLPAAMQGPQSPGPPQSPSAALPARPASLSPGPAFSLRPSLSPGPSLPSGPLPSPGPAFAPGSNVSASAVGADAPPRRATLGSALGLVGALVVVAAVAFGALLFALERGRRGESPPPSASASAPAPLVPIDPNLKPAPCARKRPRRSRPASFSWARMAKTRRPTRNLRIT